MTAADLVAALEARGVRLTPDGPDHLWVEPATLLAPTELEELRRAKSDVLLLLATRRAGAAVVSVWPWPEYEALLAERRRDAVGCSRCGSCSERHLYLRTEAGPLCSACWVAAGTPWR